MGEQTNISWADATLNFWIGCTAVSNGPQGACKFCYAETWGNRFGVAWGVGEPRRRCLHTRAKAMVLERKAIAAGAPFFCFSNSLADIFDKEVPIEWLAEAFDDMRASPHVTYLLLTKRAPLIAERCAAAGGLPANAWIGGTFVTQAEWDRDSRHLREAQIATGAQLTFGSFEPLMGPIEFDMRDGPPGWVITGGESGAHARPSHPDWFRGLRDQCAATGVAYHHKQNGEWVAYGQHNGKPGENLGLPGKPRANVELEGETMFRVGKKAAGRLLDGDIHDARPAMRA